MKRRRLLARAPLLALVLLVCALLAPPAQAQTSPRYFSSTGHYLRGAFRTFWEGRGGLPVFGNPITEEFTRRADGKIVQFFERARFELNVRNGQAYVELGRLGAEVTGIQQTTNSLGGAFRTFWNRNGGTAIFGQPLTAEYREAQPDGTQRVVQWFERSRFELWGNTVRLTLLGQLLAPPQLLAPWPPDVAPGAPLNEDGTPLPPGGGGGGSGQPGGNAVRTAPGSGGPGTVFTVQGEGFSPNEGVSLWLTAPDTQVRPIETQPSADAAGSITGAGIRFSSAGFTNGRWAITAQGISSGRAVVGYFTVTGPVGDPARLGIIIHPSLVAEGRGSVAPLAAVPGSAFAFAASGFDPGEGVGAWLTPPGGGALQVVNEAAIVRDGKGNISVIVQPQNGPEGIWLVTAQGKNTRRAVTGRFKITRDYFAPINTPRPANVNGKVSPAEGGRRVQFRLTGTGFRANERLEHWVTTPDGAYYLNPQMQADSRGRIGYNPGLVVQFGAQNSLGVYGYHYRGVNSGNRVDLYMTFTGAP